MKVLVADKFEQSGIDGLKRAGCEVVYEPDLKDDLLKDAIRATSADVLVVRGTKVTAPMLDAGRLALIVRAGAGYNTIDVAAASSRGIYVSNCPGKNAIAVAELTRWPMVSSATDASRTTSRICAATAGGRTTTARGAGSLVVRWR